MELRRGEVAAVVWSRGEHVRRWQELLLPRSERIVGLSLLLSAILGTVLVARAWPLLLEVGPRAGVQRYPDIIVGSITWSGSYKDFDYLLAAGLVLLHGALFLVAAALLNRVGWRWLEDLGAAGEEAPAAVRVWAGFVLYVLVVGVVRWSVPWQETLAALWLGGSVLVSHVWVAVRLGREALYAFSRHHLALLLAAGGLYFSCAGVLAAGRAWNPWSLSDAGEWLPWLWPVLVGGATVLAPLLYGRLSPRGWTRLVLGAQVLVPLLLLVLGNDAYEQGSLQLRNNVPGHTLLLLAGLALAGVLAVAVRCLRTPGLEELPSVGTLVSWPALVSLSAFLAWRAPSVSTLGFLEPFHLGELLVPWQQVVEYGRELYFDFISLQWLLGFVYGGLNSLLFEGTAASVPHALALWPALAAALIAYALLRLVGGGWALVLSPFCVPIFDRLFLAVPVLLLLALPGLLARPLGWLLVWGGLSTLHIFYNPSAGAALAAATAPVAVFMAWRGLGGGAWRHLWRQRRVAVLGTALGLGLAAILGGRYVFGLLEFIRQNGAANTTAYGVSWLEYYSSLPDWLPWRSVLGWEALRVGGWCFGAVALGALCFRARLWGPGAEPERRAATVLGLSGALFVVLCIPYSMGRIDPGALSRSGMLSLVVLGTLLPVGLALRQRVSPRASLPVILVGALLGLKSAFSYTEPRTRLLQPLSNLRVPWEFSLVQGQELGLPRLGRLFAPSQALEEVLRLSRAVDALSGPEGTWLDLTNHSAFYFYLGSRVPVGYVADYTAAGAQAQHRVVKELEREPPPLVWIGPRLNWDGAPASLRSYRVYRWLLEEGYVFHEQEGLQFLLHPERARRLSGVLSEEVQRKGLASVFDAHELKALPVSWGRSFRTLRRRFAPEPLVLGTPVPYRLEAGAGGRYEVVGPDPQLVWELPRELRGAEHDFLALEVDCGGGEAAARGQIFWARGGEDFTEPNSLLFDARSGPLLVPLGSHPDWLREHAVRRLRLDLDPRSGCQSYSVRHVRLLRLVD